MSLYLDASMLVPLHVEEPLSIELDRWFKSTPHRMVISDLAAAEFVSAISRQVRMDLLDPEQAAEIVDGFDRWRIQVSDPLENLPTDIRTAAALVRRAKPKLLVPDAVHLATCRRLGLTLVTHDHRMIEHAQLMAMSLLVPA